VHNFIRGLDSVPGAWTVLNDEKVKLYGSQLWNKPTPDGVAVEVKGADFKGIVHPEGLLIPCKDGSMVCFVCFLIIQYFQSFKYKHTNIRKLN
jgi:formyltetrahydrofolate dehydrogenase